MKLNQLGEDRLLAQLLPTLSSGELVVAGVGDDCALVKPPAGFNFLVLKTDCVVEGIHFLTRANPVDIGWKAMMRPLSDFAATSALPQFALVTLIVSSQTTLRWVKEIYRGLSRAAARFDVNIVGGETSGTPGPATISVSISGFVERNRCVSRRGGKAGDHLFVTGRLGRAGRGRHLRFVPRVEESRWLTKNFSIHAMIDLSDGLGADLPRLAHASEVGFEVDAGRLPRNRGVSIENAVSDGEDYELLFAISPRDSTRLQREWRKKFPRLALTGIGQLERKTRIKDQSLPHGYLHFE
jgi:thiamine-monophosphate kinase